MVRFNYCLYTLLLLTMCYYSFKDRKINVPSNVAMKADAVYEELDLPTTFRYTQCSVYGMLESGASRKEAVNLNYEEISLWHSKPGMEHQKS